MSAGKFTCAACQGIQPAAGSRVRNGRRICLGCVAAGALPRSIAAPVASVPACVKVTRCPGYTVDTRYHVDPAAAHGEFVAEWQAKRAGA